MENSRSADTQPVTETSVIVANDAVEIGISENHNDWEYAGEPMYISDGLILTSKMSPGSKMIITDYGEIKSQTPPEQAEEYLERYQKDQDLLKAFFDEAASPCL